MDVRARKDAIRRLALLARARIDDEARAGAARAVAVSVQSLPEIQAARAVLAFASFGAEISTDPLLLALLEEGKTVLLPYVEPDGPMRAAAISSLEDLVAGYRGIREPARRTDAAQATAAIVPGVAFDAAGGRLGYGGGFYDRYLADVRPDVLVGLCFDAQVVDDVPVEPHDRRVDVVVTEARIIRPRS